MLPLESQATSVGWRNSPSTGGSGGSTCSQASSPDPPTPSGGRTPQHPARGIELDDHVRALVDGPDVVVPVDADAVRERPAVEPLADLADELALGTELQQLRGRRRVRGTVGAVRACEHEDVAPRVYRHARDLAEIHPGRKLQEVRHRVELNLRNALLGDQGRREQHEHG